MLHKVFRALDRINEKKGIGERIDMLQQELTESDFESLLKMKTSIERGEFEGSGTEVVVKNRVTKVPKIAKGCSISWLDKGLAYAFRQELFLTHFFDSLALLVSSHPVTVTTPFGNSKVTNDDSITAALAVLGDVNPTLEAVLHRVQFHLHHLTALHLFAYSVAEGFGGPGTAGRLAVDLLESQLFNRLAVEQQYAFDVWEGAGAGVVGPCLALELTQQACAQLGPLPSNMAYIPLLNNIFCVEALAANNAAASAPSANLGTRKRGRGQESPPAGAVCASESREPYGCLRYVLSACAESDDGLCSTNPARRMGLLSLLGSLVADNSGIKQSGRRRDILCRSQIADQSLSRVLPLDILREIFNCFTDHTQPDTDTQRKPKRVRVARLGEAAETGASSGAFVDNFVMIAYAQGAHLVKRHGTALVSADNLDFVTVALRTHEERYRQLLDDEAYEELLDSCTCWR